MAGIIAVVAVLFVWVLATREPAQDRRTDSPLVGRAAPPIEGTTMAGEPFDLDDLRGRWVVVNFFATWCVPCRQEHPELVSFHRRHQAAGDASVVSVVFDDGGRGAAVLRRQRRRLAGGRRGGTGVILDYGVTGVPESYLVAPTGLVAAKITGG